MDDFTVAEDKQEELKCARPRVEHVFKVAFTVIGLLDHSGLPHGSQTPRQIWLQLRGDREDVSKAKVSSRNHLTVSHLSGWRTGASASPDWPQHVCLWSFLTS